jgi:hypothetical protein
MIVERGPGDFFWSMTEDEALLLLVRLSSALQSQGHKSFSLRPHRFVGSAYPYIRVELVTDEQHRRLLAEQTATEQP